MKTAMQSFWDKIALDLSIEQINKFIPEFEQAKAMEKEQIMIAYNDAIVNTVFNGKRKPEQYYKDTYDRATDTK